MFPSVNPKPHSKYRKSGFFMVIAKDSLKEIFSVSAATLGGVGGFSLKNIKHGPIDMVIIMPYQKSIS